jgi:hypothetical protein
MMMSERTTPAPGDRIRRKGTQLDTAASGLFERWDNKRGWLAIVHWDNQPFHVYEHVPLDELEIEPIDDGS